MIGDSFNKGVSPPKPTYKPVAQVDPLEELRKLMAGLAGGGFDYQAEAQQMYAPQFSYLDQLSADALKRAETAKKDIGGLYGALSSSIYGQEGGIKKNYDTGIKTVGQAYNDALGAVGNQFDNTRNNSAEILARLGIEQAAPNVVGKSNDMEALLSGILSANQMGTQNAMRIGKQASVAYNKQQGGAAKLAGAEAQSGLAQQLGAFLQQLSGKKADLQSQVNQSAFGMQADAQKSALQAAQDQYKAMIDERDFNYRMAKDKADFDLRSAAQTGNQARLDPMGNAQQLAMSLYGNAQSAGNAMKAVTDAMIEASRGGTKPSLGSLLATLQKRLAHVNNGQGPGDWSSLQRLAALLYNQ
jgi:hypothetical protein